MFFVYFFQCNLQADTILASSNYPIEDLLNTTREKVKSTRPFVLGEVYIEQFTTESAAMKP